MNDALGAVNPVRSSAPSPLRSARLSSAIPNFEPWASLRRRGLTTETQRTQSRSGQMLVDQRSRHRRRIRELHKTEEALTELAGIARPFPELNARDDVA